MSRYIQLLGTLALFLTAVESSAQKIYVVSVGISDYPGTANDLGSPTNDARAIQWIYQQNKRAETILIRNSQATVRNISNAMNKYYGKAKAEDIIVFFFAGHGSTGNLFCYDGNMSHEVITKAMSRSKARNKMIFCDACMSGSMRKDGSIKTGNSIDPSKLNVMLFMSSRDNEPSQEYGEMKNGLFTSYLQRALKGGADKNKDRVITARELYEYVSKGVKKISEDHQHPVMWGQFSDDMPVMVW